MIHYVSPFVLSKLRQQKPQGSFNGFILDCRLADFEPVLSHFEKRGRLSAQELSALLNRLNSELFEIVQQRGGFVAKIEGNFFLLIFPEVDARQVLAAAKELENIKLDTGKKQTSSSLKLRLALGYGKINWRIVMNPLQYRFGYFALDLEKLERIPAKAGKMHISARARKKLSGLDLLNEKGQPKSIRNLEPIPLNIPLDAELAKLQRKFTHSRYQHVEPQASFQDVVCVQVSLGLESIKEVEPIIQVMELVSIAFKIYMIGSRKKNKEYSILGYYGLPFKDPEMYSRACRFSLDILKKYPNMRIGVAADTVFSACLDYHAGCQYVAFGKAEQRAKELWAHTKPGQIAVDESVRMKTDKTFSFRPWQGLEKDVKQDSGQIFELTGMLRSGNISAGETFVGREDELAALEDIIDKTLEQEENYVVHICGVPGIGKTRLMVEILKLALSKGFNVLPACCQMPVSAPIDPIKQIFSSFFAMKPELDQDEALKDFRKNWKKWARGRKEFTEMEPFIAYILDLRWEESPLKLIPPNLRMRRSLEVGAHFLALVSKDVPILLAIDDLQWLDPRSRLFLGALGELGPVQIGILASTRHLEDGSIPALEIPNFKNLQIELEPLAMDESLKLCIHLLGLEELPKDTEKFFYKYNDGNPFNIEQVMSLLVEEGIVNARGEVNVPANWQLLGIEKVLLRRLKRLSDKTRDSVEMASVLGMRFNIKVLSEMLNSSPRKYLERASKSGIWKDLDEVFYIFSHILIQEAVYSTILEDKLSELHLSAAKAMEKVFAKDLLEHSAEIAVHFEKAKKPDQAALYHFKAGELYWELNFLDKSEYHFRRAADLSEAACGRESLQFCRHYFYLALLYHYQNRYDKAEPVYHEAVELAKKLHGQRSLELSPFLNNLGRFYKDIGRYREAEKLLERSLAMERKLHPTSSNIADRMNNLAHLYSKQGKMDKAQEYLERCLLIMEFPSNREHFFLGVVCDNLGRLYFSIGQIDRARELFKRSREVLSKKRGPNHPLLAISLVSMGRVHQHQNELEQAETLFLKALDIIKGPFGDYHSRTLGVVDSLKQLYARMEDSEKEAFYSEWLEKGKEYDESGTPQHYKF